MGRVLDLLKWGLTLGKEPQNFLGAGWVPFFLRSVPASKKRKWALRILGLSPHYFIHPENPAYQGLKRDNYLEASYRDCMESRELIFRELFRKQLSKDDVVLDYGCGPGFLAKVVSKHVARVYAADISQGALACAQILNPSENIEYLSAGDEGLVGIIDSTVDTAYSFAVAQHLTDEVLHTVIGIMHGKLKSGGRLLLHVQLETDKWKPEAEWRDDRSVRGAVKYRFGLHCFGRSREYFKSELQSAGFGEIRFESLLDSLEEGIESLDGQYLIVARKTGDPKS